MEIRMQGRRCQWFTCTSVVAIFDWVHDLEREARQDCVSMHEQAATTQGPQAKVHTGKIQERVSTEA